MDVIILKQAKRELRDAPKEIIFDIFALFDDLMAGKNLGMPISRPLPYIARGLHELRLSSKAGEYRVFYVIRIGDAIYVLHAASKRYYACHNCNKSFTVDVACQNCSGWNLQGYGFGTERIYTEIKKTMPSRPIWLYDDESAATRTKQQMIKKEFLSSRDGILIGSELIIEDPELTADQVLIAHIDNLFSIPDYRMNERILTLLAKLEERSKESPLLIQTKFPKHPLFKYFLEDHSKRFLEQELEERKTEELPPYTALIVISFTAKNKKEADKQTLYIRKSLESLVLSVDTLPTLTQGIKTSIILTIEKNVWLRESDELKKIFFKNMDRWDIAVDPDTIV